MLHILIDRGMYVLFLKIINHLFWCTLTGEWTFRSSRPWDAECPTRLDISKGISKGISNGHWTNLCPDATIGWKARFESPGQGELTCRSSFSSRNDIPKRGPRDTQQRYPRCSSSLLSLRCEALLLSGGLRSNRQLFHRRNCSPIRAFL